MLEYSLHIERKSVGKNINKQIKCSDFSIICEYRLLNDFGFNLYIIPSISYIITILKKEDNLK